MGRLGLAATRLHEGEYSALRVSGMVKLYPERNAAFRSADPADSHTDHSQPVLFAASPSDYCRRPSVPLGARRQTGTLAPDRAAYYILVCCSMAGLLLSVVVVRANVIHFVYLVPVFYLVLA
jgi:hypothetical protein